MTQGLRATYDREYAAIADELIRMGQKVEEAIELAMTALVESDIPLAKEVIANDEFINRMRFEIEQACLVLIATQQPTAGDLRAVVGVMHIVLELERMGEAIPSAPVVCTVRMARACIRGPESYSLGNLVRFLGVEPGNAHSALPDARAAMEVFLACAGSLPPTTAVRELPGMMGGFDTVAPPVGLPAIDGGADSLNTAASARVAIEMEYMKWHGPVAVVVTPHYLYSGGGHRYMKAYCHRDRVTKTYRVDRILAYRPARP